MYTIYFLNDNFVITTKEVETLNGSILLTESCIVTNIRKGIHFIKEPHKCLQLTDLERLIISTEFWDTDILKESDFRKQNTYLNSVCEIDSFVLRVDFATETRAYLIDIQQDVMNKIYTCSGDVGVTMHIISSDGIERIYPLSYASFQYDGQGCYVEVVEPHEIVKVWFSENEDYFLNSNTFTVIPPAPLAIVPDNLVYTNPNLYLYKDGAPLNISALQNPFWQVFSLDGLTLYDTFPVINPTDNHFQIGNFESGTGVQIGVRTQNIEGVFSYSNLLLIPHV